MPDAAVTAFLGLAALCGFALKKAIELVLEREYDAWSRDLARLVVRVAGRIHRPKRDEWWADLCFLQEEHGQSGLLPALRCLLSAPGLSLRAAVLAAPFAERYLIVEAPKRPEDEEAQPDQAAG